MISRLKRFEAYAATMREANAKPFEYGVNDSMTFVARCAERLLSIDRFASIKPKDERAARRQAFRGLVPLLSGVLGVPEPGIDDIQIGDPCVVEVGAVQTAGIWSGTRVSVFTSDGLQNIDGACVIASWRIRA